jgi:hypothetical protein
VREILKRAKEMREKGGEEAVKEETRRAVYMGLCEPNTPGANLIYTLGGADKHYPFWGGYLPQRQAELVREILKRAKEISKTAGEAGRSKGRDLVVQRAIEMKIATEDDEHAGLVYILGAAEHYDKWWDYTDEKREHLVKAIKERAVLKIKENSAHGHDIQDQRCASWNQAVYDRLILEGHNQFDLIPWAAQTYKATTSVHSSKKAAVLLEYGLLLEKDYCDALANFKASKFYPVRPKLSGQKKDKATDAAALRTWEASVETAKLRYVCEFAFPNQGKENVNSVRRRLLSCLYYVEIYRVRSFTKREKKRKKPDEADD